MSLKPAAGRAHVLQSWRNDCHAVPDGKISMACTAYRQQETSAMATALRASGISVVGTMPWGTHGCLFYETTQDLLETVGVTTEVSDVTAGAAAGSLVSTRRSAGVIRWR